MKGASRDRQSQGGVILALAQTVWKRIILSIVIAFLLHSPSGCHQNEVYGWKFRFRRRVKNSQPHAATTQELNHQHHHHQCEAVVDDPFVPSPAHTYIPTSSSSSSSSKRQPAPTFPTRASSFRKHGKPPQWLSSLPQTMSLLLQRMQAIVLYKPPVGLVAILAAFRLLWSGRIFQLFPENGGFQQHRSLHFSERAMKQQQDRVQRTKQLHWGRALDLDAEDRSYQSYGGVERVRRRLVLTALIQELSHSQHHPHHHHHHHHENVVVVDGIPQPRHPPKALIEAAMEAIQVSCPPSGSLSGFVQTMIVPLSKAEYWLWEQQVTDVMGVASSRHSVVDNNQEDTATTIQELLSVVRLAVKTAEIRALDALLRCARDRLLRTSYRLRQTERHWRRRVKIAQSTGPFLQRFFRDSIESDRMHLAYSKAAYTAELSRLGRIQKILMERPAELSDDYLLQALQMTARKPKSTAREPNSNTTSTSTTKKNWTWPSLSQYTVRINPEGKGQLKLRVYDSDANIDSQSAKDVLLSSHGGVQGTEAWTQGVHQWTEKVRHVLCGIVKECLDGSVSPTDQELRRYRDVEEHWCAYNYFNDNDNDTTTTNDATTESSTSSSLLMRPGQIRAQWDDLLQLVDNLKKFRRHGEGKLVGTEMAHRLRQLDILGLPSSLAAVGVAQLVHNVLEPRWLDIQLLVKKATVAVSTFLFQRFWQPFVGIAQDVFAAKNSSLLDAFDLPNEETSLDNMLRDCGFGDGSVESRRDAIHRATRKYEDDLRLGLMGNLFRGRLIRLLLIQVQQLKTGLLHAMANIDTLLQGNRLNVQLLATIPAILIITAGTRFVLRGWFHFRAKDLRPLSTVHGEMFETLDDMERILLLADRFKQHTAKDDDAHNHSHTHHRHNNNSNAPATLVLNVTELGELILNMHAYLVLLDFSCPPFPSRLCDAIHRLLQDMLGSAGNTQHLDIDRQVALLKLIKMKHKDLLRHI